MNLLGALFISIEAFGAAEFLSSMESKDRTTKVMTQIGFTASINEIFVFILIWLISFFILWFCEHKLSVVFDLIIAFFIYFIWRLLILVVQWLYRFVQKLAPHKIFPRTGSIFIKVLDIITMPIWVVIFLSIQIVHLFVRYILDLPLLFLSEKVIKGVVEHIFQKIATAENDMQKWHFKKIVFMGALLIIAGFTYQIIGSILVLLNIQ